MSQRKIAPGPTWSFAVETFPSTQEIRDYLEVQRTYLRDIVLEAPRTSSGLELVAYLSHSYDVLLRHLFTWVHREYFSTRSWQGQACALVGVGGYGREENCPYSDIDLLFIFPRKIDPYMEHIAERFLYSLWDAGLQVGHSIRTIEKCTQIAREDTREATSMLDARFIAGEGAIYSPLIPTLEREIFSKRSLQAFSKAKLEDLTTRHKKYRESVYILEPNIKQGMGGMRDIQTVEWLLKVKYKMSPLNAIRNHGILGKKELEEFLAAKDYLFRLRFFLHLSRNRLQDVLDFEAQKVAAEKFGFKDSKEKGLAIEQFMREYYQNAAQIKRYVENILYQIFPEKFRPRPRLSSLKFLGVGSRRSLGEGLTLQQGLIHADPDVFTKKPAALMGIFCAVQRQMAELTPQVQELIRQNLALVNDEFRHDPKIGKLFLNMMNEPRGLYKALSLCHRTGFLSVYIPEFAHLFCLVLHDLYHIYTVDAHLLFAVRELERLATHDESVSHSKTLGMAQEVLQEVKMLRVLTLAILFHDIGKGLGEGHSDRGANMMPEIGARLGLTPAEISLLTFLVKKHLLMAHITQRRDIKDPEQVIEFCKEVKDPEALRCLYLLTICDIRAVGPDVWNEWKGSLLNELYLRSLHVFETGEEALRRNSKDAQALWDRALKEIKGKYAKAQIDEIFGVIPSRLLGVSEAKDIGRYLDFILSSPLNPEEGRHAFVNGKKFKEKGFYELAFYTNDRKGLFATLSGIIAAHGLNILSVQANTFDDGRILDIFYVVDVQGKTEVNVETLTELRNDLNAVLAGEKPLDKIVKLLPEKKLLSKRTLYRRPSRVEIKNDINEYHTIVEVFAADRLGLLYDISQVFRDMQIYIETALISTDVDQAADIFYVKDQMGKKIGSKEMLSQLQANLLKALEPVETVKA